MFRKLVSALPFSPAMVEQLGFYVRRLQREQFIRRLGLLFVILAVAVQFLTLFRPPEPTLATPPTSKCSLNTKLRKDDAACRPCPYNAALWIKDRSCNPNLRLSIEAINLSSAMKATNEKAHADDRIQYTLKTTNASTAKITVPIAIPVSDTIEYGTIIDPGGGTFDNDTSKVTWGVASLNPAQTDIRSFVLQLDDNLPTTPQALDNPLSYDCALTTTYGNSFTIQIACPTSKLLETALRRLPHASLAVNIAFAITLIFAVTYFYLRSRLLARELKLIRKDFNQGAM
jgi:hypothetical protein